MTDPVLLEVAAGLGLLARRPLAILFLPNPGTADLADTEGLLAAFLEAEPDGVFLALETWLSGHGVEGRGFALVDWSQTLEVMVLGSVSISTDLPTLPLLSGAGSSTWVEHRIRLRPDHLTISVGDDPQISGSRLEAGVVPAGGFRLGIGKDPKPETEPQSETEPQPRETGLAALRVALDGGPLVNWSEPDDTLPAPPGLVLDDDRRVAITGPIVIGRHPDPVSARVDNEAVALRHGSAATSRTHVVVTSDGQTTTVTDCGSDNGTAVVPYQGAHPFKLQAWVPQELEAGAQVFLGGPSSFRMAGGGDHD